MTVGVGNSVEGLGLQGESDAEVVAKALRLVADRVEAGLVFARRCVNIVELSDGEEYLVVVEVPRLALRQEVTYA